MTASLPERPNLEHLKKSAKQLLAAHRRGDARCCGFLRGLRRFATSTDEDILSAELRLKHTQLGVAMHHGCASWSELCDQIDARRTTSAHALAAVPIEDEIPEYAGAGVPLAVVAALRHAGVDIGFAEFAAASGWAFCFGYRYEDVTPAHMAVRGDPECYGPWEVFAFLSMRDTTGLRDHVPRSSLSRPSLIQPFQRLDCAPGPFNPPQSTGASTRTSCTSTRPPRRRAASEETTGSGCRASWRSASHRKAQRGPAARSPRPCGAPGDGLGEHPG